MMTSRARPRWLWGPFSQRWKPPTANCAIKPWRSSVGGRPGCGIAEQIIAGMVEDGLSEQEARGRLYMVDVAGLLSDDMKDLSSFQQKLVQPAASLKDWQRTGKDQQILSRRCRP